MTIGAIETHYAGCRFRSRLEARWAVAFDHLGWRWNYEPEGFTADGVTYLPDFHLPDYGTWVEVKGSQSQLDDGDAHRIEAVLRRRALPGVDHLYADSAGLLLLGPIPRLDSPKARTLTFPLIQGGATLWVNHALLAKSGPRSIANPTDRRVWLTPFDADFLMLESQAVYCPPAEQAKWRQPIVDALTAARSARFEHGETPVVAR